MFSFWNFGSLLDLLACIFADGKRKILVCITLGFFSELCLWEWDLSTGRWDLEKKNWAFFFSGCFDLVCLFVFSCFYQMSINSLTHRALWFAHWSITCIPVTCFHLENVWLILLTTWRRSLSFFLVSYCSCFSARFDIRSNFTLLSLPPLEVQPSAWSKERQFFLRSHSSHSAWKRARKDYRRYSGRYAPYLRSCSPNVGVP